MEGREERERKTINCRQYGFHQVSIPCVYSLVSVCAQSHMSTCVLILTVIASECMSYNKMLECLRFQEIIAGELKFLSAQFSTSIKVFFTLKRINLVGKSELLGIIIPLTSGTRIFISGLYCVILQLTCFQGNMVLLPEKKPISALSTDLDNPAREAENAVVDGFILSLSINVSFFLC